MGWDRTVKSDMGLFTDLENADIQGTGTTPQEINNYKRIQINESIGNDLAVNHTSGSMSIGEIQQGQRKTLFGFRLYQNGSATNYCIACTCECTNVGVTAGNVHAAYLIKWMYYNSTTGNYDDIASYSVDAGMGQIGSVKWNTINFDIVFMIKTETFHGVEQKMIYGGIYSWSNDSSNYGGAYLGDSLGVQGIGTVYNLSNYDELNPDEVLFSPEFGKPSDIGGGYNEITGNTHGSFDDTSDTIGIDAKPNVGVTTAGFINVYKITQNQLTQLGEKLFPHFSMPQLLVDPQNMSVSDTIMAVLQTILGPMTIPVTGVLPMVQDLGIIDILMNGKLIDYVIDCHIIPTSISGATIEGLKVGYRQFNDIQLAKATEDYVDVDCGSLNIHEYFANFLDFCTCTAEIYLPFVGFVPVDSEYWNGGTINVKYRFNIVDGSFQCSILATSGKSNLSNSIIGQYGGVACVHLPITGLQYANVISGLINGATGAIVHASEGNIAGSVNNLANMAMLRPDNPMSNGYNASSSFLGKRTPYLLIKRPVTQFSTLYNKEMGLPLNVAMPLSQVHGFTTIDNPILNIKCSDEEYNELVNLLKGGVIF